MYGNSLEICAYFVLPHGIPRDNNATYIIQEKQAFCQGIFLRTKKGLHTQPFFLWFLLIISGSFQSTENADFPHLFSVCDLVKPCKTLSTSNKLETITVWPDTWMTHSRSDHSAAGSDTSWFHLPWSNNHSI